MKKIVRFLCWGVAVLTTIAANAYELATHAALTQNAYQQSQLVKNPDLFKSLGLDPTNANPFGEIYYDVSGTASNERKQNDFEKSKMPNSGQDFLTISGWLMRGAIREDDAYGEDNPQDDKFNPTLRRPLHHFFDPVNNRPLTVPGIGSLDSDIHKAPDWAVGSREVFTQPNAPEAGRRNHFTVFDAREAMFRALTLKRKNPDGSYTDLGPAGSLKTKKDVRNVYWATTFRALGDVVHLVQDMGQPQHTRNDQHAGRFPQVLTGHASVYEKYLDARTTGAQSHTIDGRTITPAPLDYLGASPSLPDGYPLPRFIRYSDFWSTSPGPGSATGLGLADYSNRSFFTAGTNLGSNSYTLPSNNRADYVPEQATGLTQLPFQKINFLRGGPNNIWMTTESLFDFALTTTAPTYSLNRFNYDAQARLLIPRAVAYSAGLLNYFFRGRIEAQFPSFTPTGISLKVRNAIDIKKYPEYVNETLTRGATLVAAYEYQRPSANAPGGFKTEVGSSEPLTLTEDIPPDRTSVSEYAFTLPAIPNDAEEVKYFLVYRGKLGKEDDAVVVGAFFPASGFTAQPDYTPADGKTGTRMIYRQDRWKLAGKDGFAAGNIDWKGLYADGKPTRVLSWMGPSSRSFGDEEFKDQVFKTQIFQGGELFSVAPLPVLGAAVTKDGAGKEWIIAICKQGLADVVYRRPNIKSESAALYDAVQAPEGWREIGRFSHDPEQFVDADIPWFFNADGTEAQTMRKGFVSTRMSRSWLRRLKISIASDTASLTNEDNGPGWVITGVENLDCSGGNQVYTSNGSSSGSYVVAVDYKENTPIFARYSVASTGQYTDSIIFGSGRFLDITGESTATLILPSDSVVLEHSITKQKGATTPISAQFTWQQETTYIHHLDIRHGLVATYDRRIKEQSTGQPYRNDFGVGTPMQVATRIKQNVLKGAQDIKVNEQTFNENSTMLVLPNELPGGAGRSCGYHSETSTAPTVEALVPLRGHGYWAVDSEDNLFVSQMALGRDTRFTIDKALNYVTGGNLSRIIPPGPSAAGRYYSVGVIK